VKKNSKRILLLAVFLFVLGVSSLGFAEVRKEYYESGALKAEWSYKDGKLEGLAKRYYESGALKAEVNYKDGKPEGIHKQYYKSGALKTEASFRDGNLEGISKHYYDNGEIRYIDTYKNGQKIDRKAYDEEGKLEFEHGYPYVKQD
jgi:antitoxin component YwqK of YwqJK toxin-antitoxin module